MSSPDRAAPLRRLLFGLALGLAAAGLTACADVPRPLYGKAAGTATAMRTIDVAAVPGRVGQQVRNELVFRLHGGAGDVEGKPVHRLELTVTSIDNAVGVERYRNLPAAYVERITATYALIDIASGATVTSGTSFAQAAYDYSPQRYADVRAKRDAENRVATVVAEDIRTKLAVHFAAHP
ncbi:MAG: LPS assembly lipoprotein LptE [Siculibacillus sp.]|nr:LPS assembly lipoprotein LptE [Siculibacillus sp.]